MGMMMMPPTVVSLPLKILFFVLVDGWSLLVGALVKSFSWSARICHARAFARAVPDAPFDTIYVKPSKS